MADGKTPNAEEMYDPFKDDDVKQYQEEVQSRWGDSDAYRVSSEKVRKLTKAEMDKLKDDGEKFAAELARAMDATPDSAEAQALVDKHHAGIEFFYPCPSAMYRKLGQMYVDDLRFAAYYDKHRPGLAAWLRDAIGVWCDRKETETVK